MDRQPGDTGNARRQRGGHQRLAGHLRTLIAAAEDWARGQGHRGLSLTTFIDVPWNGPWYAKQGFAPYPAADWPPGHAEIWRGQLASALDCTRRRMMAKWFQPLLSSRP